MSNLSRTPPADRRSAEQDRDAEIWDIYNALTDETRTDETRQLALDSEESAATRMRSSGSSQPVPQLTMTLLTNILESFQERLMDMIDRRLTCSAMHPFRPTKPMIRICGIVGRNGCIALHYYVHFLRIFSFRHSWDRK